MRFLTMIALALILAVVSPAAMAELTIDIPNATLDELIAARAAIQARIDELEGEMNGQILPAGTYLVGRDIAPGIYVLREAENALLPSFTLRDGDTEETLEFEIIHNQIVVELYSGQIMQILDACAYPAAIAPAIAVSADAPLDAGGYWAGGQIPPGEYIVSPADTAIFACYSLYDAPTSTGNRILEFVMVHDEARVTLKENQYIVISDCTMIPAGGE